jgi:hypothetical protein
VKITIEYEVDTTFDPTYACWARAQLPVFDTASNLVQHIVVSACGTDFAMARDRLLENIRKTELHRARTIPPPEEVEV